ncbi:tyrosine-type recombinase/integrase [Croceicoccus marinus]|jgi:integrase|uniref:Site-specific integrase n=1 Tax=Croceicoccus marinus TaxID=450378 RepID=A0A7G6VSG0_9SPHN|nr:site-specific integrase [Croceicoccus marinus]QNE04675.1 site-specific integrase [Croceicoccus marinus]
MAIRKRQWTGPDGAAKIAWLVDYKDAAGKRRAKQFSRKKDAEAWSTQTGWEVSKGVHTPDSQSITVAAAADLWIEKAEAEGRERGTVDQYRRLSRLHVKPLLGAEKLSRLTRPAVEAYRDELLKSRSRVMAGKALRALSSILGEAERRGLVAQNVARNVKVAKANRDKKKVTIPTRTELKALLDYAGDDMRPLVMLAIFTGLRSSEFRGLRWQDVDLKAGTVTVAQRADRYREIGPPKSEAGYRTIPIAPALVKELKAWKLRCPNGALGLVFPNTQGGVWEYVHLLRRQFFPLQIAAGVCDKVGEDEEGEPIMKARYGFHDLRHAAASAWIKQRIDLKRLQVWMGHSSIQITLDTFGHLLADAEGDAALIAAAQADLLSN